MALEKKYDPSQDTRRIPLNVTEESAPGLLELLSKVPHRSESSFIRGVLQAWLKQNRENGLSDEAGISLILEQFGSGGAIPTPPHKVKTFSQPPSSVQSRISTTPAATPFVTDEVDSKSAQGSKEETAIGQHIEPVVLISDKEDDGDVAFTATFLQDFFQK